MDLLVQDHQTVFLEAAKPYYQQVVAAPQTGNDKPGKNMIIELLFYSVTLNCGKYTNQWKGDPMNAVIRV